MRASCLKVNWQTAVWCRRGGLLLWLCLRQGLRCLMLMALLLLKLALMLLKLMG